MRQARSSRPGTARRALVLGAVLLVLLNSTWFSAVAVVFQVHSRWQLTPQTTSWLAIGVQWGFALGAVIASVLRLADLLPGPRLIFICALGAAIANISLLAVHSPITAIIVRVLTGFFIAGIYPPWIKLISTWYRIGRGMAVGTIVGALIVGEGLPYLVNALGGLNWRTVIITTSAATAAGGIITVGLMGEGPHRFAQARFDVRKVAAIVRQADSRLPILGYIGHMWELYAALAWFLPFAVAVFASHGRRNATLPLLLTFAVFVAGGVATWTGGLLGDRLGRQEVAIAMMAASASCCVLIGLAFAAPLWFLVLAGLAWGYSVLGDSVQFSTLVTEHAPADSVGSALTLQMAIGFWVSGLTIWLIPLVQRLVGWQWAFTILIPGPLLGLVAMCASLRARKARSPG